MNLDTSRIEKWPIISYALAHPRLAAWFVLAAGMVIMLAITARDVGLEASQWLALIITTILVAGACVWIISWEDADEIVDDESLPGATKPKDSVAKAAIIGDDSTVTHEGESHDDDADADDEDIEAAAAYVATASHDSDDDDDSGGDDGGGSDSD